MSYPPFILKTLIPKHTNERMKVQHFPRLPNESET